MTQIPAGWYPDPDPDAPEPKGQRYWDGQNWTDHVHPAPGQQQPPGQQPTAAPTGPQAPPAAQQVGYPGQQAGYPAQQTTPYAPMGGYGGVPGPAGPVTPDGEVISGWGRRAGALVIDWVIVTVVVTAVGFGWVSDIATAYSDFVSQVLESGQQGGQMPDQLEFAQSITGPIFALSLLMILVSFVYNVGMLKWRAATLGQLAVGIKVRLREQPGPLSWGTVLLRWVGKQGYKLLGLIPLVGILGSLYALLNYLWPLWDDKNQALHDKLAKTNVVRAR